MTDMYQMLINGELVDGEATLEVVNPANRQVVAHVPDCSEVQLDEAVRAARGAFPAWSRTPLEERAAMLVRAAQLLSEQARDLAPGLTREQGKPLGEARTELLGAAFWLSSTAKLRLPVTINEASDERLSRTTHGPLGVVGAISPWNYPVLLALFKLAPALLAGNTLVLKPSPFTPVTVLRIAALFRRVFPAGVLNVVTGGDRLGPWMTSHPGIDKISFTGSTATGRRVMESAAPTLKRITLELGGNDAAIVLPDVDVDAIAKDLFWGAFRNNGQVCIAAKRLYVHADIYDALTAAIVGYARSVRVGDGAEPGIQLGPVQNRLQYERVVDLVEDARRTGLHFLMGGDVDQQAEGFFVPVTIVDNPPDDARVVAEEAFGPVLPVLKFHDLDEVVRRANASEFGLAASIWTKDLDAAEQLARRLQTGTVWINEIQYLSPFTAFAGHKQSGLGVENGVDGLLEYTTPQTVSIRKAAASAG